MVGLTTRAGPNTQLRSLPQVFVSFRGDDVRESFVKDLVVKLKSKGVNVFIDTFLRGGLSLNQLFTEIEESKIAVVIFSKRFPESDWCMNELVKINKRMKEGRLIVIPVFYKVTTSDVKNLNGDFGKSFKKLVKKEYIRDPRKVQQWEASVKSIANIKGLLGTTVSPLVSQVHHAVQVWLNEMPAGEAEPPRIIRVLVTVWIYAFLVTFLLSFFIYLMDNNTKPFKSGKWMFGFPTFVAILLSVFDSLA